MLQIVVDKSVEDKNRDSFVRAIMRECDREGVVGSIVTRPSSLISNLPYVVTEPCTFISELDLRNRQLDCDRHTTVKVIMRIMETWKDLSLRVLVIGRGPVVGTPVVFELLNWTNHSVSIINSKTPENIREEKIGSADIVINAANAPIHYDGPDICDKAIIDCSGMFTFDGVPDTYYNVSDIGRSTVKRIVENYKDRWSDSNE